MTDKHPMTERQGPQDYFRTIMHTVLGQAMDAAGYELLHEAMKWSGGRYRYCKALDDEMSAYVEFQVLVHTDNAWTGKQPSRFSVNLYRSDRPGGRRSKHPRAVQRSLSALVVQDFGVAILPSASHWWTFQDTESLGNALAEAGHLIVGYGLPWLAGDLQPGDDTGAE